MQVAIKATIASQQVAKKGLPMLKMVPESDIKAQKSVLLEACGRDVKLAHVGEQILSEFGGQSEETLCALIRGATRGNTGDLPLRYYNRLLKLTRAIKCVETLNLFLRWLISVDRDPTPVFQASFKEGVFDHQSVACMVKYYVGQQAIEYALALIKKFEQMTGTQVNDVPSMCSLIETACKTSRLSIALDLLTRYKGDTMAIQDSVNIVIDSLIKGDKIQ